MERQRKTSLAIEELGIMVNEENKSDKYDITELICDLLDYPTIEEAEQHCKANRLGNFDLLAEQSRLLELLNNKDTEELKLCTCCGNIVNQKEIPFMCQLDQIRLGIGVRMYFTTLMYFMLTLLIAFFLYSLYAMITNINASKKELTKLCSQTGDCSTSNLGIGSKFAHYQSFKNQLAVQSVLGFMNVLVWGFIIAKKYYGDRQLQMELNGDWLSASQFTLMLTNYPSQHLSARSHEQTLRSVQGVFKEYEHQMKSRVSFEVIKVSIGYPMFKWDQRNHEHLVKSQKQIDEKRDLFIEWLAQRRKSKYFEVSEQRRNQESELFYQLVTNQEYERNNCYPELQDKNIIFVTLRHSRARNIIQKANKDRYSLWNKFCKKKTDDSWFPIDGVKIERAPEPDEIKWENIGFSKNAKRCRKLLIYFLAAVLIGVTLAISILLGSFQSEKKKAIFISVLISIVITIINFLIEMIIIFLSHFEREFQKSKEEASIGLKIGISQIINTIGVPVVLTFLGKETIYDEGGLVTQVFFIGLFNLLLPIGRFIDPFNILLKLREMYYEKPQRRLIKVKGQSQLNKIYTFYQFQLGYQFAYIIKTSYFTAFFIPLQPTIAIFAPIGLALMFCTNKYRLLYRFNKPNFHSSSVNNMLTFILKCSLIAFSLGQLYFMNFSSYSASFNLIINWVSFGLSLIFVFFPLKYCRKFFSQQAPPCLDYNQQQLYLTTDYDRMNPVTKEKAINEFKQFLEQYQRRGIQPLPQASMIIKRSTLEMAKSSSASILFKLEKTKFQQHLGGGLMTNDRLR